MCYRTHPYGNGANGHEEHHHHKEKKKPHIKKPLNAFMLFMKDMRAKVVAECTLKESAAINQILGRKVTTCFCFGVAAKYLNAKI